MFDVQKFMNRMGWHQNDLAEKLGCSQSRVAMWNTGRAFPRYSEFENLINLGINAEELFGKEVAEKLLGNSGASSDSSNIHDVARQMLIDSVSLTLEKLKSDGPKPPQK